MLDLRKAFHQVPIREDNMDYFGFRFEDRYYRWRTLPFGWCCSPYFHCRILRPAITHLRSHGIRLVCYSTDEILVMVPQDRIDSDKNLTISTLTRLGWAINWDKSSLAPSTCQRFIGYIVLTQNKDSLDPDPSRSNLTP